MYDNLIIFIADFVFQHPTSYISVLLFFNEYFSQNFVLTIDDKINYINTYEPTSHTNLLPLSPNNHS